MGPWTIKVTEVQGRFPGNWYDNDFVFQTRCLIQDANGKLPNLEEFYEAARGSNDPTTGFPVYHTFVVGPFVSAIVAPSGQALTNWACVDDVPVLTFGSFITSITVTQGNG